jgi:hypothetical protein
VTGSAVVDAVAALACETMQYRNPAGETVTIAALVDVRGRMMPPVVNAFALVPQQPGGRWRGARHDVRTITVPVAGPGPILERDELRRWAAVLDPTKGAGVLAVVDGPWAGRQIVCVYDAGLDTLAEDYANLSTPVLVFRAADPYWTEGVEQSLTVRLGDTSATWFPFLPLVLGSSNVFADVVITNEGDVDAWPVVTVAGPGDELTMTNKTTGKVTHLTGHIGGGSAVVIDTRPGSKTVTVDGASAFHRLTPASSLWPLIPGPNRVSIGFGNATEATTVRFAWRRGWLAA